VVGLDYDNVTVIPDRARYAEESLRDLERSLQEEKQYVNIWTVTVAKDSASTFRILFFSFTVSILILVIVVAWIGWKLWPLLEANGGIKSLFTLTPITRKRKPKREGEEESQEEEEEPESDEEEEEADSDDEEPATSEPGDMDEEMDERR
jgi:type III secretion protein J